MIPYVTISEAEEYFSTKLNTSSWDNSPLDRRERAILQATRAINRLNFIGVKVDESQPNAFPRVDDCGNPIDVGDDIQVACCELTYSFLDGVDASHEFDNIRVVSHSQDFSKTVYNPNVHPEHIIAGIPSIQSWYHLRPYLRDPRIVQIIRRS